MQFVLTQSLFLWHPGLVMSPSPRFKALSRLLSVDFGYQIPRWIFGLLDILGHLILSLSLFRPHTPFLFHSVL